MKINDTVIKNKKVLFFAAFYLISIALLILFFSKSSSKETVFNNDEQHPTVSVSQNPLLTESDLLLSKLKSLQSADEKYAALFVQSKVTPAMDSVDTQISNEESVFQNIIDSFNNKNTQLPPDEKATFDKLNTFFKQALESRRTIGNIRYALAAGNFDLDDGQKKLIKMNSDLIIKDKRIEELQNAIATNIPTPVSTTANNENKNLQASINRLEEDNSNLKQNLKEVNANFQKLKQQQAQVQTTTENDAQAAKDKASSVSPSTHDEIELAKISCNLTRADVQQIISTSKQRKDLLSQALQVLLALKNSPNNTVQVQAEKQLRELYRIAETIRD